MRESGWSIIAIEDKTEMAGYEENATDSSNFKTNPMSMFSPEIMSLYLTDLI